MYKGDRLNKSKFLVPIHLDCNTMFNTWYAKTSPSQSPSLLVSMKIVPWKSMAENFLSPMATPGALFRYW